MNFCRRCGTPLQTDNQQAYRCANSHMIYRNSSPTASAFIVTSDGQVILGRRGIEPFKGALDSIGGFLNAGESFEQGVAREIEEEASLTASEYGPLHYLNSSVQDYPFANEALPVVSANFWTRLETERPLTATDDIVELVTCPIDETTLEQIKADDVRAGFRALMEQKRAGVL